MLRIIAIGMNHETAPVELRECLGGDADNPRKALAWMRNLEAIREGLFLSTCNRVEALVVAEEADPAREAVISLMARLGGVQPGDFVPCLYVLEDMEAVRHIFKVASSLDSMVVGEPQILGQIKEAYALATREKTSGVILNRLMHRAFHVAKRVRSETEICGAAVSISYAAVELARKIFNVLEGKTVLLVGAGEMAELAARHLLTHGVSSLLVANRTLERAMDVAGRFGGAPVSFEEIDSVLPNVDIVITSTASPGYVIRRDQVRQSLRKRRNRPLFFIDIAVPRDVEPEVHELGNVYLYDIDDLKGVVASNLAQRKEEAVKAGRIVEEEVGKFEKWLKTLAVVPTIVSLQQKAESIVLAELLKSRAILDQLDPAQHEAVLTLVRSIVEKILNDPIVFLKERSGRPMVNTYLDLTKKLFHLNGMETEGHEKTTRQRD